MGAAVLLWAGLCGSTLLVAVVVAVVPGLGWEAREVLGLSFDPPAAGFGGVAGIWLHNVCVLSPAFAGPAVIRLLGRGRRLLLVLVAGQAAFGVLSVGAALGGYGLRLMPWLAHVPVEWAAVASALVLCGRYRQRRQVLALTLVIGGLLGIAAVLEVLLGPRA